MWFCDVNTARPGSTMHALNANAYYLAITKAIVMGGRDPGFTDLLSKVYRILHEQKGD